MRALAFAVALALPGIAAAQALVLSASGPSAARFAVGAKLAVGQRLALAPGDTLLLLERGRTRRLTGPLTSYAPVGIARTTTLGLLAQVARSSSLQVRELEARQAGGLRRSKTRGGGEPMLDLTHLIAKDHASPAAAQVADPRQDALPLARLVPGETRRLCLTGGEPLYVARDPRDDARAPVTLTVTADARSETLTLAPGEVFRALPDAWRAEPAIRIASRGATGEAAVIRTDEPIDAPDALLSAYAGEGCAHQAQQLYRVLTAELAH